MNKYLIRMMLFCVVLLSPLSGRGATTLETKERRALWLPPQDYDRVWQAIRASSAEGKTFKVMHIGDSHIKYGFVTEPISSALKRQYGQGIEVTHWGINGATFRTYCTDEEIGRIASEEPHLLIVSLGTNDSYTPRFSPEEMRSSMQTFCSLLKKRLPDLPIVLTTPPPCYLGITHRSVTYTGRGRSKRKVYQSSRAYAYNKHTATAARTLRYFAQTEGYGLIDLYGSIGSDPTARLWLQRGWMSADHVHYSAEGYAKQGEILAGVLIDAIEGKLNP